jgi:hypothetical protein
MKIIRRTALILLILAVVTSLFRGWLYRNFVTYRSIGLRTQYAATDQRLVHYINANTDEETNPDIEQIIKLGLSMTSSRLNFTASRNDIDPNRLISSKTAHCVGNASFFSTTCNYLPAKNDLADTWTAKPHVGQLSFLGIDVHQYLNTSFFRDHDFVTIENEITGQVLAVDPTVHDYLLIDFVTYDKGATGM